MRSFENIYVMLVWAIFYVICVLQILDIEFATEFDIVLEEFVLDCLNNIHKRWGNAKILCVYVFIHV